MKIDEKWLSGFVDGEGCFYVGINKSNDLKVGYQILPEFRIIQHKRDIELLHAIKKFFGYGSIVSNKSKTSSIFEYRIRKFENLRDVIIPFFTKNPLLTKKKFDFLSFRDVIMIIDSKKHLEKEGLNRIIRIKEKMNRNKEVYKQEKSIFD
jgi:hypothetical protein